MRFSLPQKDNRRLMQISNAPEGIFIDDVPFIVLSNTTKTTRLSIYYCLVVSGPNLGNGELTIRRHDSNSALKTTPLVHMPVESISPGTRSTELCRNVVLSS